jgi:Uma2 family endonuclease
MSTLPHLLPPASASSPLRPRDIVIDGTIRIPADVVDLESFCRWAVSERSPERGRFSYLAGEIWVDLSMEELYTHNQVREAIGRVLGGLVADGELGRFIPDGMLLRNTRAVLSTEPDAAFVSYEGWESGRVVEITGAMPGIYQLEGAPDMVLEVASLTSVRKDTEELRRLYWLAGVPEFWLVNAREDPLQFEILKLGTADYEPVRRQAGGWLKSRIFRRSFRLTQSMDRLGKPRYSLEVR